MPGITINSSEVSKLRETFREYAEWNGRELAELARKKSLDLAGGVRAGKVDGLYQTTAAIAPTEARIASDVRSQGWRIPEFFPRSGGGTRMGRGIPRMWAHFTFKAMRKGKKGRATKGELAIKNNDKPTLGEMQAFVIAMRKKARLYLASGWLGAIADLGGQMPRAETRVDHERGGATIRESPGLVEIEYWNRTPGIVETNARYGFVARAVENCIADMQIYIRRKQDEAQQFLRQRGAAA